MTMKKTSARLGAGTLALATVVAGLSFGPAANAAPAAAPAPTGAVTPTKIVAAQDGQWYAPEAYTKGPFSTQAAAEQAATPMFLQWLSDGTFNIRMNSATGACVGIQSWGGLKFSQNGSCVAWKYVNNELVSADSGDIYKLMYVEYQGGWGSNATVVEKNPTVASRLSIRMDAFNASVASVDVRARTADLSGYAVPGATVIINDTESVVADAVSGEWSYTVTGLKLGKNPITVEQFEGAGNKTGETSVEADLAVADISAAATFLPDVTKSMIIAGSAQAGADVQIFQGDTMIKTVPAADVTGHFSAEIPAPNAGGVQTYTVKQVLDGETAPDTVDVTADFGAAVSIVTPVNDAVHDGGALRFQGRGVVDGKVVLREQGKQGVIGTADVLANGIWTINTTNIPGKKATYVATLTGKGNNVTTAAVTLNPDASGAQQPIVNPIGEGSNVIIGTGGTPGATIIVRDKDGNELGRDTVDEHGNWDVTVPPTLGPGKHDLDIVERSEDGKDSDATRVVVDFGAAVDALTPSMDAPVKETRPVFTGTGQPGATVVIAGTRAEVARTQVHGDGTWSVPSTMDLPAGDYRVTATQTTGIGVRSVDTLDFQRKNDAPVATPVKLVTPTTGSTVNTKRPTFTGTGEKGATVEIRGTRATVTTTKVDDDGTWSVQSPVDLPNGDYRLFAEQTPQNGAAKSIDETTITVAYRASSDIVVETPTDTVATPVGRVTFTGKGDPNATVTISGTTAEVASGIVKIDGTFSITSTINFPAGDYRLVAKQVAQNGELKQSESFLIKVRG